MTLVAELARPRTPMPIAAAAVQHNSGMAFPLKRAHEAAQALPVTPTVQPQKREVFILGLTVEGKPFRPSDWAERLAGAMSNFRPGTVAAVGRSAFIGYSPYCVPTVSNGVKCVVVNEALRELEPMAWDFVMHFARDNRLQVADACLLPDPPRER